MSDIVKVSAYINHEGRALWVASWQTTTPPAVGDLVPLPKTVVHSDFATGEGVEAEVTLPSRTGRVVMRQWVFVEQGSMAWDAGARAGLLDVLVEPADGLFAFEQEAEDGPEVTA